MSFCQVLNILLFIYSHFRPQLYPGGQFYWWNNPEYPEKTHRPVASHWQTLSHNVVSNTPRLRLIIGTDMSFCQVLNILLFIYSHFRPCSLYESLTYEYIVGFIKISYFIHVWICHILVFFRIKIMNYYILLF
jgi:hypothetical protein